MSWRNMADDLLILSLQMEGLQNYIYNFNSFNSYTKEWGLKVSLIKQDL